MNRAGRNYNDMTLEELQQEFREAFLETDVIDDSLDAEMEEIREALNRKRSVDYLYTPEESWKQFVEDFGEYFLEAVSESNLQEKKNIDEPHKGGKKKMEGAQTRVVRLRSISALFRKGLIAAVIVALLAGAVLAADALDFMAWIPGWNPLTGRYEPVALEPADVNPIPATLTRLGITEPLYPAHLPEGFVITESHVNDDPLVLMEQYARGEKRFSITINPVEGFKTAVYQKSGEPVQEYYSGGAVHYIFAREGTITSLRYTDNYVTIVSGSIELEEIKNIIDSLSQVTS